MIKKNRNNLQRIYRFDMKDEFTAAMHEELTINAETEIKHKAACIWKLLGNNYFMEDLRNYCALYRLTIQQAIKYKNPSNPFNLWEK